MFKLSTSTHNHSVADPSGVRSSSVHQEFFVDKRSKDMLPAQPEPASEKFGITSRSAFIQCVSCKRITGRFYLVANWLSAQIFFAVMPSMFSCNVVGTEGPH